MPLGSFEDEEDTDVDLADPEKTRLREELRIARATCEDQRRELERREKRIRALEGAEREIARLNEDVRRIGIENSQLKLALKEARNKR